MSNRPKGYGASAEAKRKQDAKYDVEREREATQWIEAVIGRPVFDGKCGPEAVHEVLCDGLILIELANKLRELDPSGSLGDKLTPGKSNMPFTKMDNIGKYLTFSEKCMGVQKLDLFQTVDLFEKQNMAAVINEIHALGRRASTKGIPVPQLGPKEAEENKREFTEEQLKEGQNIIGLQMGSNKGASQAGDHFGRARQVAGVDAYK